MGLHFLKSALSLPIPDHKELTIGHAYEEYQPTVVYIPAVDARNQPLKNLIADGEKVYKGTLIGTGVDDFPVYSSVSGRVLGHKLMMMADGKVRDCLEIENDKQAHWVLKPALKRVDRCTKDEIMAAINTGMVKVEQVQELVASRPPKLEVVLTGRNPPEELLELADYVSEIHKVRHPFDRGVPARDGIER